MLKINLNNKDKEQSKSTKFIVGDKVSNAYDFNINFIDTTSDTGYKSVTIPGGSKFIVVSVKETWFDPIYILKFDKENNDEDKFVTGLLQISKPEHLDEFGLI